MPDAPPSKSTIRPHLGQMSHARALRTVAWVAEFLGVSTSWVYKAAERGELPCQRVGAALRFRPEEIRQYLDDSRKK